MQCEVTYMSGAGNILAVLQSKPGLHEQMPFYAKSLCSGYPHTPLADGVLLVTTLSQEEILVHYFNSDGSTGMMCGNGARCVVRYALEQALVHPVDGKVRLWLAGTCYNATIEDSTIAIHFPPPRTIELHRPLELDGTTIPVSYVNIESDHIVLRSRDISISLQSMPKIIAFLERLRYHPDFPNGVNVNLYQLDGGSIRLWTYERGVERITGACGTGALATAAVLWLQGEVPLMTLEIIPPSEEYLSVTIDATENTISQLTLRGNVRTLCSTVVDIR